MQYILEKKKDSTTMLPARILEPNQIRKALSPLAWKILKLLAEKSYYPKELGKKLKMHEQKIYYHIRNLEKAGLVKIEREERRRGALTKYYSITDPAIALVLKPLEPATKLFSTKKDHENFLYPFIENGKFNATIVIGNPEPHGPTKERGHDGLYATDLALFLGTFLNHIPSSSIMFDTEIKDLKKNLILIGGPGVNAITTKVNNKLPIKFKKVKYRNNYYTGFYSNLSKKTYSDESYGIIVKTKNPFDKTKYILVVAGIRYFGTYAAVLAFLTKFDDLVKGNPHNRKIHARIIDAIDIDSDGKIDLVEFVE
ncbi:MAG: ArsR family transcriptional regulator [Candidatus Aenigmatarchaeota archaeon]